MLQHIDYSHTEETVYHILSLHGFGGAIGAIYVPRNRKKGTNLGYAFVDFLAPEYAVTCIRRLDGQLLSNLPTERACRAAYSKRQGEEFLNHCADAIWTPVGIHRAQRMQQQTDSLPRISGLSAYGRANVLQ